MKYWLWWNRYPIMLSIGFVCLCALIGGIWGLDLRAVATAGVFGFFDFMAIAYPFWDELEPRKPAPRLPRAQRKELAKAEADILLQKRIKELEEEHGIERLP